MVRVRRCEQQRGGETVLEVFWTRGISPSRVGEVRNEDEDTRGYQNGFPSKRKYLQSV